jgi:hypothetical protein
LSNSKMEAFLERRKIVEAAKTVLENLRPEVTRVSGGSCDVTEARIILEMPGLSGMDSFGKGKAIGYLARSVAKHIEKLVYDAIRIAEGDLIKAKQDAQTEALQFLAEMVEPKKEAESVSE